MPASLWTAVGDPERFGYKESEPEDLLPTRFSGQTYP